MITSCFEISFQHLIRYYCWSIGQRQHEFHLFFFWRNLGFSRSKYLAASTLSLAQLHVVGFALVEKYLTRFRRIHWTFLAISNIYWLLFVCSLLHWLVLWFFLCHPHFKLNLKLWSIDNIDLNNLTHSIFLLHWLARHKIVYAQCQYFWFGTNEFKDRR